VDIRSLLPADSSAYGFDNVGEALTASPDDWHDSYTRLRRDRTYPGYEETTRLATDLRKLLG